jgi:carbonic anhydrase
MRTLTKEMQAQLNPGMAIDLLKEGNKRFVNNLKINRNLLQQVNETSDGQHPFAFILSCIDSRTSAELVFDQGLGDIFSCRIAGNVLNEDILGSMEFACKVAGAKVIVVLGHSKCGAIKGACDHVNLGNLTTLLKKVQPAIDAEVETNTDRTSNNSSFVEHVAELNVRLTLKQIVLQSPILAEMVRKGEIALVGGMYNVETGVVEFYDSETITADTLVHQMAEVTSH